MLILTLILQMSLMLVGALHATIPSNFLQMTCLAEQVSMVKEADRTNLIFGDKVEAPYIKQTALRLSVCNLSSVCQVMKFKHQRQHHWMVE